MWACLLHSVHPHRGHPQSCPLQWSCDSLGWPALAPRALLGRTFSWMTGRFLNLILFSYSHYIWDFRGIGIFLPMVYRMNIWLHLVTYALILIFFRAKSQKVVLFLFNFLFKMNTCMGSNWTVVALYAITNSSHSHYHTGPLCFHPRDEEAEAWDSHVRMSRRVALNVSSLILARCRGHTVPVIYRRGIRMQMRLVLCFHNDWEFS